MNAPIAPGIVTSLSPFLVQLGADGVAQPCQRVAPAQIGQRGGVLILGGQRVWLGQYDSPGPAQLPKARHLALTTATTVQTGTDTTITTGWTSGAKDDASGIPFTGGMFIAPSAGVYLLNVGAMWAANATGFRWIQFRHNGVLGPTTRSNPAPSGVTTQTLTQIVNAAAGDALGCTYHQTSGGGLACGGHATQTWLQCARIS